jgi:hypothetical protein
MLIYSAAIRWVTISLLPFKGGIQNRYGGTNAF